MRENEMNEKGVNSFVLFVLEHHRCMPVLRLQTIIRKLFHALPFSFYTYSKKITFQNVNFYIPQLHFGLCVSEA